MKILITREKHICRFVFFEFAYINFAEDQLIIRRIKKTKIKCMEEYINCYQIYKKNQKLQLNLLYKIKHYVQWDHDGTETDKTSLPFEKKYIYKHVWHYKNGQFTRSKRKFYVSTYTILVLNFCEIFKKILFTTYTLSKFKLITQFYSWCSDFLEQKLYSNKKKEEKLQEKIADLFPTTF